MAGRGRPRELTLDEVIDAALSLIDEQGVDALSLRALARRLNTGTATLYGYVASRDELIEMMLGHDLSSRAALPEVVSVEQGTAVLIAYLLEDFRVALERPALLQLWHQRPDVPLGAVAALEAQLAFLEGLGFSPMRAAEVHVILSSQLLGHIGRAAAFAKPPETAVQGTNLGAAQRHVSALGEARLYELALRALATALVSELMPVQHP